VGALSHVGFDATETRILAVPALIVRGRRDLRMGGELADATLVDILDACGARRLNSR